MAFSKPKASAAARGYDYAHRQEAKRRAALHTPTSPCSACGHALGPQYKTDRRGRQVTRWHLPHTPDKTSYLPGLQHDHCNISEGSSRGARITNARRRNSPTPRTSRTWQ